MNPFDAPDGRFTVLVNAEGQHSLWPDGTDAPGGWSAVHGPADRTSCLDYVTAHWTDQRPRGVAAYLTTDSRP